LFTPLSIPKKIWLSIFLLLLLLTASLFYLLPAAGSLSETELKEITMDVLQSENVNVNGFSSYRQLVTTRRSYDAIELWIVSNHPGLIRSQRTVIIYNSSPGKFGLAYDLFHNRVSNVEIIGQPALGSAIPKLAAALSQRNPTLKLTQKTNLFLNHTDFTLK
jgi:hypothetical protein